MTLVLLLLTLVDKNSCRPTCIDWNFKNKYYSCHYTDVPKLYDFITILITALIAFN